MFTDDEILAEVRKYAAPIEESIGETIGRSYVLLDGRRSSCRTRECNLGNVVTDAMLEDQVTYKGEERWSDVSIAMTNAGAIRAAIPSGNYEEQIMLRLATCMILTGSVLVGKLQTNEY